jgi:hypothetical protein
VPLTLRQLAWNPDHQRDFGQVWFAARAILEGQNPYVLIGPGLAYDWTWPFVYPLTSAIVAIPFAPFSESVASVVFAAVGTGCLTWALMEHGYGPLFLFISLPVQDAIGAAQWSPLLASTFAIGPLAFLLAAKPTIGAALFAAHPRRSALIGGIVLILAAFVVQPDWPRDAMAAMGRYRQVVAPAASFHQIIRFPGGALALLCLLRWRRPEARLVAVMACVPLTISHYEMVPLLLVPRTFGQATLMVLLSYSHPVLMKALVLPPWTRTEFVDAAGAILVLTAFLPVTLMILRRPNEGAVPAWLDASLARWPAWLRGAGPASTR